MTQGEQTDVPESADWYNSSYIIARGSNVPQTRTGRPLLYRSALQRHQDRRHYAGLLGGGKAQRPVAGPKQGTDSALAMAMGHVILKEFHLDNPSDYFLNYCRRYTDMPMLVLLDEQADGRVVRAACCVHRIWPTGWVKPIIRSGKPSPLTWPEIWWRRMVPSASAGVKRQMEHGVAGRGTGNRADAFLLITHDSVADVAFPYFGATRTRISAA